MDQKRKHKFFKKMILIRAFETVALDLFSKGKIQGTTHTCIGQEANAVGIVSCINKNDYIFSNHRNHGHYVAFTDDVEGLLLELMGNESGVSSGLGGSQHIHNDHFLSNAIQGGIVSNAAGMALAQKLKKSDNIVVCFMGDGTFGEGNVYEALNMSSLWDLPILFAIENNKYAQSTPIELCLAGKISKRFEAFNIETDELESFNVFEINKMAEKAINKVRENSKPFGLIINTYRFSPHSKGDDYRDKKEIESMKKFDPLIIAADILKINDYSQMLQEKINWIWSIADSI